MAKGCSDPVAFLILVVVLIPVCIVIGAILAVFLIVFGSLPIYFYCWIYLLHLMTY